MYDVLETIFSEFLTMFGITQFHMGGNKIHIGCWNASTEIGTWLEQIGNGRENKTVIEKRALLIIFIMVKL